MIEKERKKNPTLTVRVNEEDRQWLINESFNYRSWNLFIKELKKRYENNAT